LGTGYRFRYHDNDLVGLTPASSLSENPQTPASAHIVDLSIMNDHIFIKLISQGAIEEAKLGQLAL
jgi:hypothetical protein